MRARFDFGPGDGWSPLLFRSPARLIVARSLAEVPEAMAAVDRGLRDGWHAAGYVAYEAAPAFDRALTAHRSSPMPLVFFGLFRAPETAAPLDGSDPVADASWTPSVTPAEHARGVAAIREAIAAGDTYQINYTFRLNATLDPASLDSMYEHLALAERVPYAAYLDLGDMRILSLSPELFFERDGTHLMTRPMKGTAPRGRWASEDAMRQRELATSAKDRAENIMIVDLCRNDLSRVCQVGSVRATSLCDTHPHATVWQMTSTVEGEAKPGTGLRDIFAALFPAGSITGAPKSSSTRLIAALEAAPRGVYCGAIGFASPDGRATFNVAIRTLTVDAASGRAEYGVGGGITWDSVAASEHAEAISKAACLEVRRPFSLIETMRLEDGVVVRLDRHLARLRDSAAYLGLSCDLDHVRSAIDLHAALYVGGIRRMRVELAPDGRVRTESREPDGAPADPAPFALASSPVDHRDLFLCHKTTRRDVYDRHLSEHPGVFDVLLWNDRRELTEFTRGNLVVEHEGRRLTPARACGLLAGAFRAELLDAGTIREAVLPVDDLASYARIWFINSLREWVPLAPVRR